MQDIAQAELLLDVAVTAALEAGSLIYQSIDTDFSISKKANGNYDLVTEMDLASEALIRSIVTARFPQSMFLAEESGGDHNLEPLTWVVDPIDGTVNYAHGIPMYCISIAAVQNNHPLAGVIYNPATNEMFTAFKGGGAFLNGARLSVSTTNDITQSVLATGFPYNVAENPYDCIGAFTDVVSKGIPIRRLGSAALDLAYVAAGRLDGFWEVQLNEWDVAAGILMVLEAGGVVETYGETPPLSVIITNRVLATNGKIGSALARILGRH